MLTEIRATKLLGARRRAMSAALGLRMAFVACGRFVLAPDRVTPAGASKTVPRATAAAKPYSN